MESGLWTLFFSLLVGMTGLSIKQPAVYKKLSNLIRIACFLVIFPIVAYNVTVTYTFGSLAQSIDLSQMTAALQQKNSLMASWAVTFCAGFVCMYSVACEFIADHVRSE